MTAKIVNFPGIVIRGPLKPVSPPKETEDTKPKPAKEKAD